MTIYGIRILQLISVYSNVLSRIMRAINRSIYFVHQIIYSIV